jgi:hypothetical protein
VRSSSDGGKLPPFQPRRSSHGPGSAASWAVTNAPLPVARLALIVGGAGQAIGSRGEEVKSVTETPVDVRSAPGVPVHERGIEGPRHKRARGHTSDRYPSQRPLTQESQPSPTPESNVRDDIWPTLSSMDRTNWSPAQPVHGTASSDAEPSTVVTLCAASGFATSKIRPLPNAPPSVAACCARCSAPPRAPSPRAAGRRAETARVPEATLRAAKANR